MVDIIVDCESTGLDASSSQLIAIGCYDNNTEHIFFANSPDEEKKVIEDFFEYISLSSEPRLITYYGSYYDIPFIVSRALTLGVDMARFKVMLIKQIDVYDVVKGTLKLFKNSLSDICKFLHIEKNFMIDGKEMPNIYLRAVAEKDEATKDKIKDHLKDDLITLKKVWEKLLPVIDVNRWEKS